MGDTLACVVRRATISRCEIRQGTRAAGAFLNAPSEPDTVAVAVAVTLADDCSPNPSDNPERSPILDEPAVTRLVCARNPFETFDPLFGVVRSDQRYLAIAGVPPGSDPLVRADFRDAYGVGLARPEVPASIDDPSRPEPICTGPGGTLVDPAVHWARAIQYDPDLISVCGNDLRSRVNEVVRRLGDTLASSCIPDFVPEDIARCDVLAADDHECAQPGLERVTLQPSGRMSCRVRRDSWTVETSSELTLSLCGHTPFPRRIVLADGLQPRGGASLICPRASCTSDDDCTRLSGGAPGFECDPILSQCRPR
jgi:hypothetical protein